MALTLFAENLLETATVTAPVVDLSPLSRLYDRDHGPQYEPGFEQAWAPFYAIFPLPLALDGLALAQIDIDIDLGSAKPVSGWAAVNHNITGVTATLFGDSSFPPTTSRDSVAPAGATFLRTFATLTLRYWRLRIPAMAVAPMIGEFLLGVPHTIAQNPILESAGRVVVGNVVRDRTPAGYPRKTKRGAPRVRLSYAWNHMDSATDYAALAAVFALLDEGARNLLVKDEMDVLRFMEVADSELTPVPIIPSAAGMVANAARLTLEEIPL